MDRKLALLDHLRQTELRATSSRVASVIGHLIGTPLNVIAGRAALIRSNPTAEYATENARRIEEQVERLAQRVRRLIEYLTAPEPSSESRAVQHVIADALSLYGPVAAQRGVAVLAPEAPLPDALVDGTSALVVLTSLLSLALRIALRGQAIRMSVATSAAGAVVFELAVPGMDLPKVRIDRLEPPEEGGRIDADRLQALSVCFAIARRNGGSVDVVADPPRGALIRFECRAV
jgi:signal transduction histidine kinase